MKFKFKKIVLLVILIIICVGLVRLYENNGTSRRKQRKIKAEFESYISETYKDRDFLVSDVRYESHEGHTVQMHTAMVTSEKEGLYFFIEKSKGGRIIEEYNMRSGNLDDYKLVEKFSKEIEDAIKEEIPDILLGNEGDSYIIMNIKQGKYMNRDIKFTKDLDEDFIVNISLMSDAHKEEDINIAKNSKAQDIKAINIAKNLNDYFYRNKYKGILGIIVSFDSKYIFIDSDNIGIENNKIESLIKEGSLEVIEKEDGGLDIKI